MLCPRTQFGSTEMEVLKLYCLVTQFRLYADETFKIRQMGNAVLLPEKGFSGKRISLLIRR
jgi:hypothetical protein